MSIFAKRYGGKVLMPMILYILNEIFSALLIRFSITIINLNSEMTTWHFLYILKTPTLYICLLFHLPLRIILLLYCKYKAHLHRQCERVVICTKKMCIYVIHKNTVFHSVLFSVPRFSKTQWPWVPNEQVKVLAFYNQ